MNLIRYSYPTATDFEQLFGALLPATSRYSGVTGGQTVDLSEDAENYFVKVGLPGVKKEDITVELDNGSLTVSAKHAACATACEKEVEFQRSINVPEGVDAAKIQAVYENGLLTLTLPKPEAVKPRRIDLN